MQLSKNLIFCFSLSLSLSLSISPLKRPLREENANTTINRPFPEFVTHLLDGLHFTQLPRDPSTFSEGVWTLQTHPTPTVSEKVRLDT